MEIKNHAKGGSNADRKRVADIVLYITLALICFVTYFLFLGSYPLLDVDETRYVDMAKQMFHTKDFLTLYLNGDYFFEKPPLFFWLECLSFKISGNISELTSRIPIVILSLLPAGLLFYLSKKVKATKFAFINVVILMTSLEYIFMTKMAILDSVLTSLVTSACFCYFLTFFAKEQNKKYFWNLTYIFTGLAVLAKGIPGVAIPFGVILLSSIYFKTLKDTSKHSLIGMLIMLAIILPWHVIMLTTHNPLFFQEYIVKHHIQRFLGAETIHRSQPFYFYFLTILWGFFPHIFTFLANLISPGKLQKWMSEGGLRKGFPKPADDFDKFIRLNIIAALTTLLFFSSSGTKLITYILPIYPFMAVITGKIWYDFIENRKNENLVKNSACLLDIILLLCGIAACFAGMVLPPEIYAGIKPLQIFLVILLITFATVNLWTIQNRKNFANFISLAIFMSILSGFGTPMVYNFEYSFGQNDLMAFAKYAKEQNKTISTYKTGRRYSLLYYSDLNQITFHEENSGWLNNELKKENNLLIVRNKDINKIPAKFNICQKGIKYSVIENKI